MKKLTKIEQKAINKIAEIDASEIIKLRIKKAADLGFKMAVISEQCEVSEFRLCSVVSPATYRKATSFKLHESKKINEYLDTIKESI